MNDSLKCSVCGRRNVKLWRPKMDATPLICAECAEQRQSPRYYNETFINANGVCTATGRKVPISKWTIDEKGLIPIFPKLASNEASFELTNEIIVCLKDVSGAYPASETRMVPAIPSEGDGYCHSDSTPAEFYKWWETLPTR